MTALRNLSARPELLVSDRPDSVADPDRSRVGRPGPFGRARVLFALPLDDGPVQLAAPDVVHDDQTAFLADPDGNLIGKPAVRVSRLKTTRWTEDTRRLSG